MSSVSARTFAATSRADDTLTQSQQTVFRGATLTRDGGPARRGACPMFARYLKSQLIVLLCGGLVGPIFLIVFFTLGLGALLQWMLYVGLLITVADVVIALALANFGAKSSAKNAE